MQYKQWLTDQYPTGVDDLEWDTIMDEDQSHPYEMYPLTYPPPTEQPQGDLPEDETVSNDDDPQFGSVNPNAYGFSSETY